MEDARIERSKRSAKASSRLSRVWSSLQGNTMFLELSALFSLSFTVQLTFRRLLLRARDALSDSRIQARYRYFLSLSLTPLSYSLLLLRNLLRNSFRRPFYVLCQTCSELSGYSRRYARFFDPGDAMNSRNRNRNRKQGYPRV